MKISVNDVELFTITQTQLDVFADEIPSAELEADLKRRLEWVLIHKYETCYKNLSDKWTPLLIERGVESIPTNKDSFAQLVFSQPDYLDRTERDAQNPGI